MEQVVDLLQRGVVHDGSKVNVQGVIRVKNGEVLIESDPKSLQFVDESEVDQLQAKVAALAKENHRLSLEVNKNQQSVLSQKMLERELQMERAMVLDLSENLSSIKLELSRKTSELEETTKHTDILKQGTTQLLNDWDHQVDTLKHKSAEDLERAKLEHRKSVDVINTLQSDAEAKDKELARLAQANEVAVKEKLQLEAQLKSVYLELQRKEEASRLGDQLKEKEPKRQSKLTALFAGKKRRASSAAALQPIGSAAK